VSENGARGVWGWLLQRVTAVGLIVVAGVHVYVLHFAGGHAELTAAAASARLDALAYMLVSYSLLAFVLYHGLYGLRSVILDYTTGERAVRVVTAGLWVIGLLAFCYGALALVRFMKG
jgi:succinate dehydrogenase hydrophobic anchor subunit